MRDAEPANLLKAQQFYKYAISKEWDEVSKLVSDDFAVVEADDLPFGGIIRGKPAVRRIFELIQESIRIDRVDVLQVLSSGDYVVSLMVMHTRAEDGSDLKIEFAEMLRFADGVIIELKPFYFNHHLVHQAVAAARKAS